MRFASKFGRFGVQIRPMVQEAYATGMARVVQEPIYAIFEPWLLQPHERDIALGHWSFNGFNQMEDQVSVLPPDNRIGVYDSRLDQASKGFSDEVRLDVERVLIANAAMTDNMIVMPISAFPPPWPNYDEYAGTPAALMRKLMDEGHDLVATLGWERASLNRPLVIEGLEALIADPDGELVEAEVEEVLG
jgi:hypothetical protein